MGWGKHDRQVAHPAKWSFNDRRQVSVHRSALLSEYEGLMSAESIGQYDAEAHHRSYDSRAIVSTQDSQDFQDLHDILLILKILYIM